MKRNGYGALKPFHKMSTENSGSAAAAASTDSTVRRGPGGKLVIPTENDYLGLYATQEKLRAKLGLQQNLLPQIAALRSRERDILNDFLAGTVTFLLNGKSVDILRLAILHDVANSP